MEVLITKEFDEFSLPLLTEQSNKAKSHNIKSNNDNNNVDSDVTCVANIDKTTDDKELVVVNSVPKYLEAPKSLSDTELIVQNLLFDMKPSEYSLTNSDEKTDINCSINSYHSCNKNLSMCLPTSTFTSNSSDQSQASSAADSIYLDINSMANKKRGFLIEEISKDETSQNSQSMSTYSNDYTCFLSEQTDATNNLTPFKRSNSYYFDSPMKKLCTGMLSNEEKSNDVNSCNLYSNQNDINLYSGFTSIQNNLEVDCVQDRYDGSDSGFGSELTEEKNSIGLDSAILTSSLPYKNNFALNQESSFEDLQRTSNEFLSAMEVLKPKFTDSLLDAIPLEVSNYGMIKGILKHNKPIDYGILTSDETTVKKRKNINFANVTVFYFPRVQGFTCVPSQVIFVLQFKLIP